MEGHLMAKSIIGGVVGGVTQKAPSAYGRARGRVNLPWGAGPNTAEAQLSAMGSVGTLFAIVHRTSNATSQVDWKLWRKSPDQRRKFGPVDDRRIEVTKHAALDLWNNPNPFMTRQHLVETVQQHIDLVGEGPIVIYRDPRSPLPLELWPVRPDRITPIPGDDFLAGYIYTGANGEQVPLSVDDVIHLKMPNPLDPYRGLGPVQAAMVDLDSARFSAEWNRNFFINSAEPGGIIEVPDRLDDDAFRELTERWREQHQGVAQAHRVAVLEQGTWKDRSMSQRDMQFVQLRGLAREVIREAFGIHGHMLGNSQDVNKANAEAGEISFARWLVKPRCERIKQALNHRLLPMFDATDLEFDHDRVVPEDREADDRERTSLADAAKTWVEAGFDPAAVLAYLGMPDLPYVGPPQKASTGAPE
ncbi:MAG: phage portal protein [Dehalococcoidia bacterium]|nr:MAG: phage portal protein [Dehalococcoidia bacterium]